MREVKFRAWDEEYEMMLNMSSDGFWGIEKFFGALNDRCILMQYTGLRDKNGIEIYEGDIVKFVTKGGYSVRGVTDIKYYDEPYCFLSLSGGSERYRSHKERPLGSSGSSTPYKPYTWNSYKILEVVGNIHENLELLEKK